MKDLPIEPNAELFELKTSKREMMLTLLEILDNDDPLHVRLCMDETHKEAKRQYFIIKNMLPIFKRDGEFEGDFGEGAERAIKELLKITDESITRMFKIVRMLITISESKEKVQKDIREMSDDGRISIEALRKARGYVDSHTIQPSKN